jgi:hypothetical protein
MNEQGNEMSNLDKTLFINGFWDGFNGEYTFAADGAYCAGWMEGAKLSGLVTEDELLSYIEE